MTNKIHSAILAGMLMSTQDILMGQHIGSGSRISGELHKEPGHAKLRAKRKRERINKRNARNGK